MEDKYIFNVTEDDKLLPTTDINHNGSTIELNEKQVSNISEKGIDKFKVVDNILAEIVECFQIEDKKV